MGGLTDLGPARAAEIDRDGMFAEVAGLPRQLREGYEAARGRLAGAFFGTFPAVPPAEPSGIAVCGMGGSAIGADLVLACLPGPQRARRPWCAGTRSRSGSARSRWSSW